MHALVLLVVLAGEPTAFANWTQANTTYQIPLELGSAWGKGAEQRLLLQPKLEVDLPADWQFEVDLRLEADGEHELRRQDRNRAEWGTVVLARQWQKLSLRLGRDQVAWGQLDGIAVLDLINPRRFDSFILDEEPARRIPSLMVNGEYLGNRAEIQFLWIPENSRHQAAQPGTAFQFTSTRLIPSLPEGFGLNIQQQPRSDRWRRGDGALRLSTAVNGWDLTFNYLYHEDDAPVIDPQIDPENKLVTANFRYRHHHVLGGTATGSFGSWVIRSEYAWIADRRVTGPITPAEADDLTYGIGADYRSGDYFLSMQVVNRHLIGASGPTLRARRDNTLTFKAVRQFLNETLALDLEAVHNTTDGDGLLRGDLNWEVTQNTDLAVGLARFQGDPTGLYGQFGGETRLTARCTVTF